MTFKKDTLTPRLKALSDRDMGRSILGRVAVLAVKEAHALVPVKTGNLRRTIRVGQITSTSARILAGGQREVGYAAAVEFGTKAACHRPAQGKGARVGRQPAALGHAALGRQGRVLCNEGQPSGQSREAVSGAGRPEPPCGRPG